MISSEPLAVGPRTVGGLASGWLSVVVATVLTALLFVALHTYGWAGSVPLPELLALLAAAVVMSHGGRILWGTEPALWQLRLIVALKLFALTTLMYVTGWGPVLAVGYVFVVADVVTEYGARAARPALGSIIVALCAGETLIATGTIHTYVPEPQVHVIALLTGLAVLFVVHYMHERACHHERATAELHALFEDNPAPMWIVDEETRQFIEVNKAACELYGYTRDEFLSQRLDDLRPKQDVDGFRTRFRNRPPGFKRVQARHVCKDGRFIEVDASAHELLYERRRSVLVTLMDVTKRNNLEAELRHLALHDPLTGLGNRRFFRDCVNEVLRRFDYEMGPVAALVADLDGFRTVNDSLGHAAGDTILAEVARRFRSVLSDGDTIARLGGDEFGVLVLRVANADDAGAVARRLMDTLAAPITLGSGSVTIHASIGIVVEDRRTATADALLRDADAAMHAAKAEGKNNYRFFQPSMHTAALKRIDLSESLRRAVSNDELRLVYQPVVDAHTSEVVGLEALVRWQHPSKGLIVPADFIPLAEETGLIIDVGRRVLDEATRDMSRSLREIGAAPAHLGVSVNVSRRQLSDAYFVDDVLRAITTAHLARSSLTLEITESVLASDTDAERARLQALRELGVRIAIDDFGTGYSSLAALRDLPIDIIKVDKKFIRDVPDVAESTEVVAAIIRLAQALGLQTVAEGVEQRAQAECLRDIGCDFLQGYAICRPLPLAEVQRFVASRRREGHAPMTGATSA